MSTRGVVTIIKNGRETKHYIWSDAYPDFARETFEKAIKEMKEDYEDEHYFIVKANCIAGYRWLDDAEYDEDADITNELTWIEHKWIINLDSKKVEEDLQWQKKRNIYFRKLTPKIQKNVRVRPHKRRI